MLITFVFYEWPAAGHEIDNWVTSMGPKISFGYENKETGMRFYKVIREDHLEEKLVCYPSYKLSGFIMEEMRNEVFTNNYHKTLLFGKFNSKQLRTISILIEEFENGTELSTT